MIILKQVDIKTWIIIFVSVTFSEKPQIIDIFTSSNTDKEEGDRVELKCAASGIPTPVISWTMAGGGVLPTGGRELTVSYCIYSASYVNV